MNNTKRWAVNPDHILLSVQERDGARYTFITLRQGNDDFVIALGPGRPSFESQLEAAIVCLGSSERKEDVEFK